MFKNKLSMSLIVIMASVLMSCSSEPKVTELISTADPQIELDRVDSNIIHAQNTQVDILAPKNFENAKKYWNKAVDARAANNEQPYVLHQIAVSQAYLDRANSAADVGRQILKGSIEARQDALATRAFKNYPQEMNSADNDFKNLTVQIENNDTSSANSKSSQIEALYRKIELNSIKKDKLGVAQANIEEAINEGAAKLTPDTLSWAQKKFAQDEAVIVASRHNSGEVNKASLDATTAANRLLKMVRNAKGSSAKNPEELAKQLEKNEVAMARSEKNMDIVENQLSATQNKLAHASTKNAKLESDAWLDNEFESARAMFTKDEAEVYKQGDTLLIRLKGLSFENNKAVIGASQYPLLAKVQKVISSVGLSQIVIEGHTDSSGGKKLNDLLSAKRAESVQSYLVSNKDIVSDKITAEGFGDSKPISTNKTAAGRAQNRRVDVIITAEPVIE